MKVAIYVRSSQDKHDVSCDAQENQIREIVKRNDEELYNVFTDKALSSTRDVRPAFDEMIVLATNKQEKPFKKIYCLDTSRFGRDHYESQMLLHQLRQKHGVQVVFVNMPKSGTYMDTVMESIMSAFDYLHSQQSKVKGVASMKQNVRHGYRAGGIAPYGYQLKKFELDAMRKGSQVTKTKLEPNPETAPFAKEYLERRSKGETRMAILQDFYERGIPSPSGRASWPASSGKAIEDNIKVYLGHTVFNRLNERVKIRGKLDGYKGGVKYKPEQEWVISENTHEPIVSVEIAQRLQRMKEKGIRATPITAKRIYPLAGVLKCGVCGTSYIGDRVIYRCNATTQAGKKCGNEGISGKIAEDAIFSFIQDRLLNYDNIDKIINNVKSRMKNEDGETGDLQKRLKKIVSEIDKYVDLYRDDILDKNDLLRRTEPLKEQKTAIESKLQEQLNKRAVGEVSKKDILEVIENLREEVRHADKAARKRVVQRLFDRISVLPKEGEEQGRCLEIKGSSLPLTRVNMASPTGFEPVLSA